MEVIKQRKEGQYYDILLAAAQKKFGWNTETTDENIKVSLDHRMLKEVMFRGKVAYRIIKSNDEALNNHTVLVKDYVSSAETQTNFTETNFTDIRYEQKVATLQQDFDDFKRFMWGDEVINLKTQVKDANDCGDKNNLSPQEKLFEKLQNDLKNTEKNLVISLENRISSLEKQLSEKQSIIESLLNKITITTTNDQLTITGNKKGNNTLHFN